MSAKLFTDNERRIIRVLREGPRCYNELYRKLSRFTSRPTLRIDLDHLISLGVVAEEKRKRKGQRKLIWLTEVLTLLEKKMERLETAWEDLFYKLNQLERCVEDGILDLKEAGSMLVWLVYDALPLLAIGLIGVKSFSFDARRRLYDFSREKFNNYWKDILRLGHKYPEVSQGFKKGCKDLNAYVKPAVEAVEDWFKQLAEFKQHKGK